MSANYEDWSIRGGAAAAQFTSFLGLQYYNSAGLPEKPVEEGSFFTANKWDTPYNISVEVAKMGEIGEIQAFLDALDEILASLEFCEVVTPAKAFVNGNVEAIDYKWHNDEYGPRMLVANIHIKEVREPGGQKNQSGAAAGGAGGGAGGSSAGQSASSGGSMGGISSPSNSNCQSSTSCGRMQGTTVTGVKGLSA